MLKMVCLAPKISINLYVARSTNFDVTLNTHIAYYHALITFTIQNIKMGSVRLDVILNHLKGNLKQPNCSLKGTSVKKFKYTLDNNLLEYEQRIFYEENGFILIPNLIEHSLLEECREQFKNLCEDRIEKNGMTLMKDISLIEVGVKGEHLYNKVQDIVWDDVFSKYILHPKILDYVECFTGPNITAVHSMLINKPPDSGKGSSQHPLHQDLHYFPFRPADRIVASWTAMEPVNMDNGCLFVLPGSHKGQLLQHDYPENLVNKMYHGVKGYENYPRTNLLMNKGDTVFFHPLLIHGSGVNVTKGFRKAISCHYAASDCNYIDVQGTSQENVAREIENVAKKRIGLNLNYQDIWKFRARIVRGQAITLC